MLSWRFTLKFPETSLEYQSILGRVRKIIVGLTQFAQVTAMKEAPGRKLKRDITRQTEPSRFGQVGLVWIPRRLAYTYEGTEAHFIPGPAASKGAAARMQMDRGHPLRFYWEREGKIVIAWAIDHPGIRNPDPWNWRVIDQVQERGDREFNQLWEYILARWGGRALPSPEM